MPSGVRLGEAQAGPANIRLGLQTSFAAILEATQACLEQAGLSSRDLPRITACLALAGASEPTELTAAQRLKHPFRRAIVVTDAQAACLGAHQGRDGGVLVVGTGSIGWAEVKGRQYRVGGWGSVLSDEGSGAWLGRELLVRLLWAHDGRIAETALLKEAFEQFHCDAHAIVRWAASALPRDLAAFAPLIVEHGQRGDAVGTELMTLAGLHVDALAARLVAMGVENLALVGGLAAPMRSWISAATKAHLIRPAGDALDGALQLARTAAKAVAA